MADYNHTATDRVLDAVHDYLPTRAQAWVEDRAFHKQLDQVAAGAGVDQGPREASLWDRVKDFAYKHAPEWVQQRVDDNRAIARVTESLKHGLVQSGEWAKAAGDRTVPDEAWKSHEQFIDEVHKGKGLETAWVDEGCDRQFTALR